MSVLVAFGVFFWRFGFEVLDPTNISWLMSHEDLAQHYIGWLFFRNEPWNFPVGKISGFMYPIGTNIVLTDSNALLSIPLKFFSFLLPSEFQFIGIWFLLCYCLQGLLGYLLMTTITRNPSLKVLGSVFFFLSPALLF